MTRHDATALLRDLADALDELGRETVTTRNIKADVALGRASAALGMLMAVTSVRAAKTGEP